MPALALGVLGLVGLMILAVMYAGSLRHRAARDDVSAPAAPDEQPATVPAPADPFAGVDLARREPAAPAAQGDPFAAARMARAREERPVSTRDPAAADLPSPEPGELVGHGPWQAALRDAETAYGRLQLAVEAQESGQLDAALSHRRAARLLLETALLRTEPWAREVVAKLSAADPQVASIESARERWNAQARDLRRAEGD